MFLKIISCFVNLSSKEHCLKQITDPSKKYHHALELPGQKLKHKGYSNRCKKNHTKIIEKI